MNNPEVTEYVCEETGKETLMLEISEDGMKPLEIEIFIESQAPIENDEVLGVVLSISDAEDLAQRILAVVK